MPQWPIHNNYSTGGTRYLSGRASAGDTGSIVSHAESTESATASAKLGPSDLRAQLGTVSGAGAGAGVGGRCARGRAPRSR